MELKRPVLLPPLPEVETLTVPVEQLQPMDIIALTHEKVQTVGRTHRKGFKGYFDVTVDTHDSVMHVPAGETFEVLRMTGRLVDRLTGEVVRR